MIQLVQSYAIKDAPRQHLVDCLLAHKKTTLLEIAKKQSIIVKKRHTKQVIAIDLAKHIIHRFDEDYLLLEEDEKKELADRVKKSEATNYSDQEASPLSLQLKGYLYFFIENQQIKSVVPLELTEKLVNIDSTVINVTELKTASWFSKNKKAVEKIYATCSLIHLVTVWNNHSKKPLTTEEARHFFIG
ncbi:hypothetical protein SAMN04488700_1532 [Carnobacterium iners]|uniref:Uncharacterized protein n=1 Tax=Carnobacterium iners TaxID=1073423 RepID=A0A1X7NA13_9LACT|nr:hypothetical protein [Carnobacterium iners]SEL27481.1 hypothetical protein SAMN04488114_14410 [Carnobacterium iners]SMH33477.1 hypothetical protein SAMN04488700_1532 [Carnobacterium iners]